MSTEKRRVYTAEEKAAILRRHLSDKVPVSDLCDELGLQPSVFYGWRQQLFDNAALVLNGTGKKKLRSESTALTRERQKVEALESKLTRKNEVISEISQDLVDLKKSLGES